MQCASITFEGIVEKQKCQITVDLSTDYDKPISAEAMREMLVQVAIKLTNPAELAVLANELATPGTAPKALAAGAAAENAALPRRSCGRR